MSFGPFDVARHEPIEGLKANVSALLKREVRKLMILVLEDRIRHAEVVAAGRTRFRHVFVKDMGAAFGKNRGACDHLANVVFRFFEVQWRDRYKDLTPKQFLDSVQIKTPWTEDEIDDAWEVEIGSSESAMQQMYEGSARTRKGKLEEMGVKRRMEKPS